MDCFNLSVICVVLSLTLSSATDDLLSVNSQSLFANNDIVPVQANSSNVASRYSCYLCDGEPCDYIYKCNNAIMCFEISIEKNDYISYSRGCVTSKDKIPFYCHTKHHIKKINKTASFRQQSFRQYSARCCDTNLCNNYPMPTLAPRFNQVETEAKTEKNTKILELTLSILGPIIAFSIIAAMVLFIMKFRHKRRMEEMDERDMTALYKDDLHAVAAGDSTLREIFEHSITSGSGSGLPLLIQRTLAKQIDIVECIGKGRYGEVWKGIWQGEHVAVKVFFSRDEASWSRETEIYSTVLIRHENVLGYIGSDMTSRNSCTQLWLVTHYHQLGSLYDHLNRTTLSVSQVMQLIITAISGLTHIHTEIFGTQGKPAIAHRDIKSKNILVKTDGSCCIADFGLAVLHTASNGQLNIAENSRVGTKRYMAPEILDESINACEFESFRRADMYAFGLVMWEVSRRCSSEGIAEEYKVPFYDVVTSDPSFEDMKKVVCVDQYRPNIPNRWLLHSVLAPMTKLMKECWHHNSSVRLTSLRLKKSLLKIAESDDSVKLDF